MKNPPGQRELQQLASLKGLEVKDLLNPASKAFKSYGKNLDDITSKEAEEIITGNPRAMYRPLFTDGHWLVVGFKPDEVESLFKI